jgi:ABC-type nickel/cobalt efflux system permease component RcnA
MLSFATILALGFLLGMRHATDPDHVVAITTIVTKHEGIAKAGLIGALWGLGHTFTIFAVGMMIILFRVSIPPRLGLSMEFAVAGMLILLGVLNLTGVIGRMQDKFSPTPQRVSVANQSGGETDSFSRGVSIVESSESAASKSWADRAFYRLGRYDAIRPLVIGIVHGLAGSAAVALLVMTTIHDPWWSIAYLLLFSLGTVAGMMCITAAIAMPLALTVGKFAGWNRRMAIASGLLSLGFGLFLSYQIGFVDGLFKLHPQWTPR